MTRVALPQTFQKYPWSFNMADVFSKFMPKYDEKKDSGRKTIVTTVKTRTAWLFDSAMIASSFCSMVRSWKS